MKHQRTRLYKIAALSILVSSTNISIAQSDSAQNSGNPDFILLGAGITPQYEGADTVDPTPVLAIRLHRGQRYIAFQGTTLSANLVDHSKWEAGPWLNYVFARDNSVDSDAVAALDEIDAATELGAFVAWNTRTYSPLVDSIRVEGRLSGDTSEVYDDWKATLAGTLQRSVSPRLSGGLRMSLTAVGDGYSETYFSISENAGTRSGLAPFQAEGGLLHVGLALDARYALNKRLSLSGFLASRQLVGDAADSPIVADEGSSSQISAGLGFGYLF